MAFNPSWLSILHSFLIPKYAAVA